MPADDLLSLAVSGAVLGKLLGISERRVRELRDQGVIPDDGAGRYILGLAVSAYCSHLRPASGGGAAGGSESAGELDRARIRLVKAQAEARELLNAQMRGDAVMAEDLDAVVGTVLDGVRSKVLAVPTAAAPRVIGMREIVDVQRCLTSMVHDALADAAEMEIVVAVKDRARRRAGRGLVGEEALEESAVSD